MNSNLLERSLIIVGPAGSGKSALGQRLSQLLQLDVYPAGEKFRDECSKRGIDIADLKQVPQEEVLILDRETDNYMRGVIGQRMIITARTAAMFAHAMAEQKVIDRTSYVAVGINCTYETRAKRKHKSLKKEAEISGAVVPNPKVLEADLRERDMDDMTRLRFLYRSDYGMKSWDSLFGVPPCDLVLNSERMTVEQEVQQVLALLGFINALAGELSR